MLTPSVSHKVLTGLLAVAATYEGQADELEAAIGFYFVGAMYGWRALYLIHSKRTVSKYASVLGVDVREVFAEVGPCADRAVVVRAAAEVSNFWKAVSGELNLGVSSAERRRLGP